MSSLLSDPMYIKFSVQSSSISSESQPQNCVDAPAIFLMNVSSGFTPKFCKTDLDNSDPTVTAILFSAANFARYVANSTVVAAATASGAANTRGPIVIIPSTARWARLFHVASNDLLVLC